MGARVQRQVQLQRTVRPHRRVRPARPAHPQRAAAGRPQPAGLLQLAHPGPPEAGRRSRTTRTRAGPSRATTRRNTTVVCGSARVGQRLAALGEAAAGNPAAAPDQRAALVVPAPDEARFFRGHGVDAGAADQGWRTRRRNPTGGRIARRSRRGADQRAPFPVRHQRVLAQDVRGTRRPRPDCSWSCSPHSTPVVRLPRPDRPKRSGRRHGFRPG